MGLRNTGRSLLASFLPSTNRLRARLARCSAGALFALAPLLAGGPALAADEPVATLSPLQADGGAITAAPGKDVTLAAVERIGDRRIAGQKVEWSVTGPGKAELSPASGKTSAQTANGEAGIATTVFHASVAGTYDVVATTQKNPGCATRNCATWVSTRFSITVDGSGAGAGEGAGAADASGHSSRGAMIAAAVIGAGAIAIAASSHGGNHQDNVPVVQVDRTIEIAGGDGQSATPNRRLALPLQVLVKDDGTPASGINVQWTASPGVTLAAPGSGSNSSGVATMTVMDAGPGPGPISIWASRSDNHSATVRFTIAFAQPALSIVSGDDQSGLTGHRATSPLVVEASIGTMPQANIPIAWAVASGDATVTSVSNGGNTNTGGLSQAVITYGPTPGPITVTATRMDGTGLSQTFSLSSSVSNSLSIVSGDAQSGAPNRQLPQRLVVEARTNNAPAAGVTINWSASNGATLSAPTSVTGAGGQASIRVTNMGSTLGPVQVTATRADDPSATVLFTESILPPSMAIASGDGQSGLIGTAAAQPLKVHLVDGGGVGYANQTISWVVTAGSATLASGASVTDGTGHATMTFTFGNFPGPISIQASAFGGLDTVTFSETATTATGLSKLSGDNQVGAAGTTLPVPLKVQIQASPGSPSLAGVPVSFTVVSGTASVTTGATVTDALGQAQTSVILGLTPGAVQVLAQVSGGPSATFSETISGTLVSSNMTIASGNLQTIDPNTPSQPLVILLKGSGSPLANQTIQWSTTSGTLSQSTTTTDAQGHASVTLTPTTTGPMQVTASFAGFAQYTASQATFSENTTLGAIPALATNEVSTAVALDTACSQLQLISNRTAQQQDLLNQCLSLSQSTTVSDTAAAEAIHQMTPRVAETQSSTATTATTAQFDNLAGRMNALRGGARGVSFAGLNFNGSNGSLPLLDIGAMLLGAADQDKKKDDSSAFARWGLFASGQIGRQDASAQGSTPGYSLDTSGITVGVDYRVNDGFVLGGAMGYTRQVTDLDGGGGNLTMSGWSLSGYGTWYRKNDWYVDGSLTWGNDTFDSQRHIAYSLPLPGGGNVNVDQVARASSGGNDLAASLAVGRDFHRKRMNYGFYGKLQYSHQNFDAFSEQLNGLLPGSGLGLSVDARTNTSVASVLGGKIDFNNSANWGVWIPHAEAEWQHEFRTDPAAFTATFLDDPTATPIRIKGDATDSDFFRLGVGMSFVLPQGRSAFVLYNRTIGRSGITEYNVSLGFRVEF